MTTTYRIDLHIHSTASDGALPPAEVVFLALRRRLNAIALTDHDTMEGIPAALAAAEDSLLEVLPGIELATRDADGDESVDVLGYLFDPTHQEVRSRLAALREGRRSRAARIVGKLAALGLPLDLDRVYAIGGSGSVGRPHLAQALLEAGYVADRQEAFDRYIGDSGPAYVPHPRLTMVEAITMLHAAGGVAVLAHPIRVERVEERLPAWVDAGLDGLEVYYPDHTPAFTARMRALARRHDLVMTGGSDFHRVQDRKIVLGTVSVPPDAVLNLQARASRYR